MSEELKTAREIERGIALRYLDKEWTTIYHPGKADWPVIEQAAIRFGYDAGLAANAAEVERLKDALRGICDMPEYDQDDCHRLRNMAGVALGKEDAEGETE